MDPHSVSGLEKNPSPPAIDWAGLRQLSLKPGGFGQQRITLWPQLLNVKPTSGQTEANLRKGKRDATPGEEAEDDTIKPHPDERQVQLDTDRSFVLYPVAEMDSRVKQQNELHELIVNIFRKRRRLSYFQGYHDIISVIFLTLPQELQFPVAEKLSLHRVRDSMGSSLEPVLGLLRVLSQILRAADAEYASLLEQNAPLPYFALSNLLTLFSHDMPTLPLIQHVFDYLLCRPPIFVVYLAAAVVLSRKQEVERLEQEGEEGMTHSLLSGLPNIYDLEDAVEEGEASAGRTEHSLKGSEDGLAVDLDGLHGQDDAGRDATGASHKTVPPESAHSATEAQMSRDGSLTPAEDASVSDESTLAPLEEDALVASGDAKVSKEAGSVLATVQEQNGLISEDVQLDAISDEPNLNQLNTSANAENLDFNRAGIPEAILESSPMFADMDSSPKGHIIGHEREGTKSSVSSSESHVTNKPRVSLSSLMERADELYTLYPPTHPDIQLATIMGPQSVVFTWSENFADLPSDNTAELMATQPQLIVLPVPEEHNNKEHEQDEDEAEKGTIAKRRRRKLRKPVRIGAMVIERRAVVASAVIVLGVAMAVYGLQAAPERNHGATKELRKLTRYVGGIVLGMSGRLWHGLVNH